MTISGRPPAELQQKDHFEEGGYRVKAWPFYRLG
jgi:hypothetical protein